MRIRKRPILFLAAGLVLLFVGDAFAKQRVLVYTGKLLDERSSPIGGVFPLTFAFYAKKRGGKALWNENHFVAVDNGAYVVELGRKSKIQSSVKIDNLYVGVRITGGPELVRERFVAEGQEPEEIIRHQGPQAKGPGGRQPNSGTVEFAEKAGFAYVAEKADSAVRLDGLTLEQLKKAVGGGGGGGDYVVVFGDKVFDAQQAGGDGGTPFRQLCPEGYAVTGLAGGSGLYIDRVGIICSPLKIERAKTKKK